MSMLSITPYFAPGRNSLEVPQTEPDGFAEKVFCWLRSDENAMLYRIGALALPLIVGYGIGLLIGYPTLVPTMVALTTCFSVFLGWISISVREFLIAKTAANVKNAFGGEEAFNALPQLNLGGRPFNGDYLDFLQVEDLPHSVVKGIDGFGRPFISLKLRSNADAFRDENPFVVTFFQRYTNSITWTWGSRVNGNELPFGSTLGDADCNIIHQIVVDRNHPVLSLV